MGICWGIVQEEDRAGLDRWRGVIAAGLTPRLVIPIGGGDGVELTRDADGEIHERGVDVAEVFAEVALLVTDDLLHDEVERRFDGFSVFLPDQGGVRRLPPIGFERNATACGASRLLALDGNEGIDVQLRTAAQVALAHGLAIEISY